MRNVYDVVIVGGGHNGLVAAIELTNADLSVCILEARSTVGGCAITSEPLLPGFKHNPHANNLVFADLFPPAIAPSTLGVTTIEPEAQFGVAFADGRPPVILHRPDRLNDTRASLKAYSRKDAAKYVEMKRRSAALDAILHCGLYAPPNTKWFAEQRNAVRKAYKGFFRADGLGRRSARELIDELFETDEIRIAMYALAIETGVGLEERGSDLSFLGQSLWIVGRWRQPVGGMQVYSDALLDAARGAGVDIRLSMPVKRIVVKDGRAVGVVTAHDEEISAAQGIISAVPLLKLFDGLLGRADISPSEDAEIEAFRSTVPAAIATSAYCLDWRPRYKSGRHDPAIDNCLKTVIGFETSRDVRNLVAAVSAGLLPHPAGAVRVPSLSDASLAPSGSHIAAVDSSFPGMGMSQSIWSQLAQAFPKAFYDVWQRYLTEVHSSPPMTMTSDDTFGFERRMLMRLGEAQYRTSIKRLFLAGPGVYPGGGVHGACGHNAAGVLLNDAAIEENRNR